MIWFIFRRVLWAIPVLLFLLLVTFTLAHLAAGSPWDQAGRQLPPSVARSLNEKYGLDQPFAVQFITYLWHVAHFDFGLSYQYQNQSVSQLILESWPYTATLGLVTFVLVVPIGIGLGVVAAVRHNGPVDYATLALATIGASIPNFVLGITLVIVFSVGLNSVTKGAFSLPTGGFGLDEHLILPTLTLGALPTAYIARLTRSAMLEVLNQDYVRTAWAKGLRERAVVIRHALRNALIPVVTALGIVFALLVSGSVVVESVFAIPGIGRSFVAGVEARDYPMILGTTVLYAVVIVVANLVVDLVYGLIDPRVRLK